MKIEYDKQAEAIYIPLVDIADGGVAYTEELVPDTVMLDKDKLGYIVGIEVLGIDGVEDITNKAPLSKSKDE